jgi:hypothetical protein
MEALWTAIGVVLGIGSYQVIKAAIRHQMNRGQ